MVPKLTMMDRIMDSVEWLENFYNHNATGVGFASNLNAALGVGLTVGAGLVFYGKDGATGVYNFNALIWGVRTDGTISIDSLVTIQGVTAELTSQYGIDSAAPLALPINGGAGNYAGIFLHISEQGNSQDVVVTNLDVGPLNIGINVRAGCI